MNNAASRANQRILDEAADHVRTGLQRHGIRILALTQAAKKRAETHDWQGPSDLAGVNHHEHGVTHLHAAVYAALQRGDDPTRDPDVQRVVTARAITPSLTLQPVRALATQTYAETVADHAGAIVEKLTPRFNADHTALRRAADTLGPDTNLDDAEAVLQLNARDVALPARDSRTNIADVVALLQAIDRLTLGATVPAIHHVADIDPDNWHTIDASDTGNRADPYRLVRLGITLRLTGPEEARARQRHLAEALRRPAIEYHDAAGTTRA